MLCNTGKTPNVGTLYLIRFRCVTGASNGHVGYYISSGGGALTSNENFVGIYDTGQTTPGSATQLAISADQTSNFGTTAYYSVAMTTPETLVQGQDYFFAILCNGTTATQFYGPPTGANTLINASLSGLALRCGHSVATNLTAMPSAITAANIVSTATNPCGLILV
jgi:hypothetical protein